MSNNDSLTMNDENSKKEPGSPQLENHRPVLVYGINKLCIHF